MEYYESQADTDNNILVMLGHLYFYGARGVTQDFAKAAQKYQKAHDRVCVNTVHV